MIKTKLPIAVCFALSFACMLLSGCTGEKKPEGMPEIHSTVIKIESEGKALTDASVSLVPVDKTQTWTAGGTTDSSGTATMMTFAKFPGAPAGKFKVCVTKTLVEPDPNADPDSPSVGSISYDLVDDKYANPDTSDFEVEVVAGQKNTAKFDVGPTVKTETVAH